MGMSQPPKSTMRAPSSRWVALSSVLSVIVVPCRGMAAGTARHYRSAVPQSPNATELDQPGCGGDEEPAPREPDHPVEGEQVVPGERRLAVQCPERLPVRPRGWS